MSSMMNGYHFDRAADGHNSYSIYLNTERIIYDANFRSAFSNYGSLKLYLKEQEENGHGKVHVSMVKELDIKDSLNNNIVLKSSNTDWIGEKIYNITGACDKTHAFCFK